MMADVNSWTAVAVPAVWQTELADQRNLALAALFPAEGIEAILQRGHGC